MRLSASFLALVFSAAASAAPQGFGTRANLTGPVSHWPQIFVDWLKVP